jgi:hypothetical protein
MEDWSLKFIVFQCSESPGYFVVTDTGHVEDVRKSSCPDGGELKEVGEWTEGGRELAAFNESVAMSSIADKGYYCFEAPPVAAAPPTAPML